MKDNAEKKTILIFDEHLDLCDSIWSLFGEEYNILKYTDGLEGFKMIKQHQNSIVLVLLDIQQTLGDRYDVLAHMNEEKLTNYVPVVMITQKYDEKDLERGYHLGAIDVIWKPLQMETTKKRLTNIIEFYQQKNHLEEMVKEQTKILLLQNEQYKKRNDAMMGILKDVITNRSIESEKHIRYVEEYSGILATAYRSLYPKSKMTIEKIELIKKAARVHDLGKITMPEQLIKRKGKLLPAEMDYLKEHATRGGEIVMSMVGFQDVAFLKICYNVCMYHHEKYDGTGYPMGLRGEKIPIEAQIVATADLLDALINVTSNKEAIPGEHAIAMLLAGACGELSPKMKECVNYAKEQICAFKLEE